MRERDAGRLISRYTPTAVKYDLSPPLRHTGPEVHDTNGPAELVRRVRRTDRLRDPRPDRDPFRPLPALIIEPDPPTGPHAAARSRPPIIRPRAARSSPRPPDGGQPGPTDGPALRCRPSSPPGASRSSGRRTVSRRRARAGRPLHRERRPQWLVGQRTPGKAATTKWGPRIRAVGAVLRHPLPFTTGIVLAMLVLGRNRRTDEFRPVLELLLASSCLAFQAQGAVRAVKLASGTGTGPTLLAGHGLACCRGRSSRRTPEP